MMYSMKKESVHKNGLFLLIKLFALFDMRFLILFFLFCYFPFSSKASCINDVTFQMVGGDLTDSIADNITDKSTKVCLEIREVINTIDNLRERISQLEKKMGIDQEGIHEYVDLGLPDGTLWATCNLGAFSPEDPGRYYAWGEVVGYRAITSRMFDWGTYKWMRQGCYDELHVIKYTCEDGKKTGDWYDHNKYAGSIVGGSPANYKVYKNLTELLPEDDAATAVWGDGWCIPSKKQIEDLINPKYTVMEERTIHDVTGYLITSKKNGNSIFLPAGGYQAYGAMEAMRNSRRYDGNYWTRDLRSDCSYMAYTLSFMPGKPYCSYGNRFCGCNIRPVRKDKGQVNVPNN